jgi:hypothetical protein
MKTSRYFISMAACAVGLASLATCVAAEQQTRPIVQFRAVVQDVVPLRGFEGTVISVDTDPRYVLTLRIATVNGTTNLAAGTIISFAVQSPAKIFGGQPVKGRAYDFELDRKTEGDMNSYSGLRLRKPAANKGA